MDFNKFINCIQNLTKEQINTFLTNTNDNTNVNSNNNDEKIIKNMLRKCNRTYEKNKKIVDQKPYNTIDIFVPSKINNYISYKQLIDAKHNVSKCDQLYEFCLKNCVSNALS
jgi:hypothetical protein